MLSAVPRWPFRSVDQLGPLAHKAAARPLEGGRQMTNLTKIQVQTLSTRELWAILRSTNPMSERFCNELCWTKEELRRRGFALA